PLTVKETISRGEAASEALVRKHSLQDPREPHRRSQACILRRGVQMTMNHDGRHAGQPAHKCCMRVTAMHVTVKDVVGTVLAKNMPEVTSYLPGLVGARTC